jgi:NADH dehydrogenase FAD-containing subunit
MTMATPGVADGETRVVIVGGGWAAHNLLKEGLAALADEQNVTVTVVTANRQVSLPYNSAPTARQNS